MGYPRDRDTQRRAPFHESNTALIARSSCLYGSVREWFAKALLVHALVLFDEQLQAVKADVGIELNAFPRLELVSFSSK